MLKLPFRVFHLVLLWFRVTVSMRLLLRVMLVLVLPPFPVPLFDKVPIPCLRVNAPPPHSARAAAMLLAYSNTFMHLKGSQTASLVAECVSRSMQKGY
jgi:hypothetical protein